MLFCSRCGAQVVPGSASCRACGAPITPTVDTPDLLKRPALVTLLAVLQFIGAAIFLLAALGFGASAMGEGRDTESVLILALLAGFGLVQLVCGIGLWQLQRYGRTLQLVLAVIGLLGIPLGTIISICILVYLTKPGIKVLFSGKTAAELTPTELSAIAVLSRSSTATTVLIVVVVVLVSVAVVGILAAIAIPGLLRARMSGNEAAAIGTIRTLVSAEISYSSANGGLFDTPECLMAPARCLPKYSGAPLDSTYGSAFSKGGYDFRFYPGAPADSETVQTRGLSPTSLTTFSCVAVPTTPGTTGSRSFCGDSTGQLCWMPVDAAMVVEGGCPVTCRAIQ